MRGLQLSELRRNLGMTQVEVAKAMGVTQANISRIERGEDAQLSTLDKYAAALGGTLSVHILFDDELAEPLELAGKTKPS